MDSLRAFLICVYHYLRGEQQAAIVQHSRRCCDTALLQTIVSGGWLLAIGACGIWERTVAGCLS